MNRSEHPPSINHGELYRVLRDELGQLEQQVTVNHPMPERIQGKYLQAQTLFQQILGLEGSGLMLDQVDAIQPIQVELNRLFRLVGVDVMFLQSARQPHTRMQRQAMLRDRLQTMHTFCDHLLSVVEERTTEPRGEQ